MKLKPSERVKKQAKARARGTNQASRKRDLDFVGFSLVKMRLVDSGCGYDVVSKREIALIRRLVSKAQHSMIFHSKQANSVGKRR